MSIPVLYSFRRCPFAIRARIAIFLAGIQVEIREVILRNKPQDMLDISYKGTVPVLQLPNGEVIDESINIMQWALEKKDPLGLLNTNTDQEELGELILINIPQLNKAIREYKFIDKYPDVDPRVSESNLLNHINYYDKLLSKNNYLVSSGIKLYDYALFPFIRQIISHNRCLLEENRLKKLLFWHDQIIVSEPFISVMQKYKGWEKGDNITYFPK